MTIGEEIDARKTMRKLEQRKKKMKMKKKKRKVRNGRQESGAAKKRKGKEMRY